MYMGSINAVPGTASGWAYTGAEQRVFPNYATDPGPLIVPQGDANATTPLIDFNKPVFAGLSLGAVLFILAAIYIATRR